MKAKQPQKHTKKTRTRVTDNRASSNGTAFASCGPERRPQGAVDRAAGTMPFASFGMLSLSVVDHERSAARALRTSAPVSPRRRSSKWPWRRPSARFLSRCGFRLCTAHGTRSPRPGARGPTRSGSLWWCAPLFHCRRDSGTAGRS